MIKNITAGTLLTSLVASLLIGVTGLGAFSYYAVNQSAERSVSALQMGRDLSAATQAAQAADAAAQLQAVAMDQLASRGAKAVVTPAWQKNLREQQQTIRAQLDAASQALQRHGADTTELTGALTLQSRLEEQVEAAIKSAKPLPRGENAAKWADVGPGVGGTAEAHAARVTDAWTTQKRQIGWALGILVVLGIALAMRLRHMILRFNGRPLFIATKLVEQVAEGDLTIKVEGMDQAHTVRLAAALDKMAQNLRSVISEVAESARTVADTSAQIAQGNLDLSQRTEEQASTLEETASSMEELTSTVANNADNARQASQLAATAADTAQQGGDAVEEVVKTMDEILDASKKISEIISVIDGIAFQTNILALNAAVEAARAGDQGRGFAVVATEVRSLAHRTTAAAKEIKGLIAHSEKKVQLGSSRVDEAGHTMVGVVLSVKKVSSLIAEIAAASQEQSAGIGQVNTAVSQMEQVVQQNASLVEEATAATESMKDQAAALLQAVSRFKLSDDTLEDDEDEDEAPAVEVPKASRASKAQAAAGPSGRNKLKADAAPVSAAAARGNGRKPGTTGSNWEDY